VGLVAFSDEARTFAQPTTDHDAVRARVASLWPNEGTAMGDALRLALDDIQAARPAAPAAVLLLSDGINSAGSTPLDVAQLAAERHVPSSRSPSARRTGSSADPISRDRGNPWHPTRPCSQPSPA
jgi:Ca-activated chloride channel homolog